MTGSATPPQAGAQDGGVRASVAAGGRQWDLWLLDVGLACCAVEFAAATLDAPALRAARVHPVAGSPERANVLVVSGTVTLRNQPAVLRLYERMPQPRHVLSFGSCANTGGPYWDSYAVVAGIGTALPVDVHVPGCPPRPEALLEGLRLLDRLLAERDGAGPVETADPVRR